MKCRFCKQELGQYERCRMRKKDDGSLEVAHDHDCLFTMIRREGALTIYRLNAFSGGTQA